MSALQAALAAAPILLVLGFMVGAGWSAFRAGLVGLAAAALLAVLIFDFSVQAPAPLSLSFAGVAAEAGFTTATILWILWPALALHQLQQQSGATDTLRGALTRLTQDRFLQVLLVGWFLALFLEGAAGFGTPVALAAPILVGLGVSPPKAVVLALLGHSLGVSFGALGTPVLAQAALTGSDAGAIAWRAAALHLLLGGVMMAFFSRAALSDGLVGSPRPWASSAFAAAAFLLPCVAVATWLGPELATLGSALVGGSIFIAVLRWQAPRARASFAGVPRALAPYIVLVMLVLASRAWPPAFGWLQQQAWEWRWQERFGGRIQFITHPGTLLFLALLVGAWMQGLRASALVQAFGGSARRLLPVMLALLTMLALSRLMLHGGLIGALQVGAVQGLGQAWPLVAPAVGALGSIVTGSATASNILFSSLQAQTAQSLGLPAVALLAAQTVGAAIGNIACPHNVVAGAATVGLAGREGSILRATLWPCATYLLLAGGLFWLILRLAPAAAG